MGEHLVGLAFFLVLWCTQLISAERTHLSFNEGWRFYSSKEDTFAERKGVANPMSPNFDDSSWETVILPHDWAIGGPFQPLLEGRTGKLPWTGVGWYRKELSLTENDSKKTISLEIDGAMSESRIYLNGEEISFWPNGYTAYQVELPQKHLKFSDEKNSIAIRLENRPQSSHRYPGAGLYRDVWLTKTNPVRFAHNGIHIRNPLKDGKTTRVEILAEVVGANKDYQVSFEAFQNGQSIGRMNPTSLKTEPYLLDLTQPQQWTLEQPTFVKVVARLHQGEKTVDEVTLSTGIRTIAFLYQNGFILNGQETELKGVCLHHDLGPLGTAFNKSAARRQIRLLKSMGCNAIRTAHNPPAPGFVQVCDEEGMLLVIEAFDIWDTPKLKNDYARFFTDWHQKDLKAMVRNFRNSPSVIIWSLGNEVAGNSQNSSTGISSARNLSNIVRKEDSTRPIALCGHSINSVKYLWKEFDLLGLSYKPRSFINSRSRTGDLPLFSAESASTCSSRGEYFYPMKWNRSTGYDLATFQISSYDRSTPPWGFPAEVELDGIAQSRPWNLGQFVWAGFDYLGEPWPFLPNHIIKRMPKSKPIRVKSSQLQTVSPARSSYYGIMDLCGFPKDRFFLYQAAWQPDLPVAHLLPHWNWPHRIGEVTPVHLYTNGDEAELFLNGKTKGRFRKGDIEAGQKSNYRIHWDAIKYEPGELKAVIYKGGKPWAERILKTTKAAAALNLQTDRLEVLADGKDLAYLTATVVDRDGLPVPTADNSLQFEIEGPGRIIATGNGDATNHTAFRSSTRKAYNSLCLAIIAIDKPSEVKVTVSSQDLTAASLVLVGKEPKQEL